MKHIKKKIATGALAGVAMLSLMGGNAFAHEGEPIAPEAEEETTPATSEAAPVSSDSSDGMPAILVVGAVGALALAGGAVIAAKVAGRNKQS